MKKTIFVVISIIVVLAMIVPYISIQNNGSADSTSSGIVENSAFSLPINQVIPERCEIDVPYKEDWETVVCETFDETTGLWTGEGAGLKVEEKDEKYIFDSTGDSEEIDYLGYAFPVLVGAADDVMLSVSGEMDCREGDCGWGVFIRSTTESIVYVFFVHNDGSYSLTGLSPQETDDNLGNIQAAVNSIINKDGENTIVAIAEGSQMMFFINGVLLATHEAYNASDPTFGVMAWGSPGTHAVTRLDNILARAN